MTEIIGMLGNSLFKYLGAACYSAAKHVSMHTHMCVHTHSFNKDQSVMKTFCGVAGRRTVFKANEVKGYCIKAFSKYQQEDEVPIIVGEM